MFLTEEQVRAVLRMEELIPAMAGALRNLSAGKVQQPMRTVLPVADHKGFFAVMPAYGGALGAKLVTFYPHNTEVHTHHAMILLFPSRDGRAACDDGWSIDHRDAHRCGLGCGYRRTRAHRCLGAGHSRIGRAGAESLEAMRIVRRFREVRVWSPRNANAFAKEFDVRAAASAEEAVRGADVIVVATAATTPVLMGEWLSPGAHINAVGATRPDWRELDDAILRRARIYVEAREAAMKESGDIIAAGNIFAEIGEVVAGTKSGRKSKEEITLFKSVGVAVEDIVAADLVWRRTRAPQDNA